MFRRFINIKLFNYSGGVELKWTELCYCRWVSCRLYMRRSLISFNISSQADCDAFCCYWLSAVLSSFLPWRSAQTLVVFLYTTAPTCRVYSLHRPTQPPAHSGNENEPKGHISLGIGYVCLVSGRSAPPLRPTPGLCPWTPLAPRLPMPTLPPSPRYATVDWLNEWMNDYLHVYYILSSGMRCIAYNSRAYCYSMRYVLHCLVRLLLI